MTISVAAGDILMGLFAVLLSVIELFAMLWIRSVQKGLEDANAGLLKQQAELSLLREQVARDYPPRQEIYQVLDRIDRKLADINDKLDRKQDKP
jgi:hypothetical protein